MRLSRLELRFFTLESCVLSACPFPAEIDLMWWIDFICALCIELYFIAHCESNYKLCYTNSLIYDYSLRDKCFDKDHRAVGAPFSMSSLERSLTTPVHSSPTSRRCTISYRLTSPTSTISLCGMFHFDFIIGLTFFGSEYLHNKI